MKNVILFTTGGTIASVSDQSIGGLIARLSGEELVSNIIGFEGTAIEIYNFKTLNSTHLRPSDMFKMYEDINKLLARDDVSAIVVTHGTSTMEETAFMLDLLVRSPKPVIITGAQRAADEPFSDGPSNIINAIRVALSPLVHEQGVLVVFAGKIYAGRDIRKTHSIALEAFTAGEKGMLGRVEKDLVKIFHKRERKTFDLRQFEDINVDIIPFYSGATERYFKAAVENDVEGLVVEGLGMGNVNENYARGIELALQHGITVVLTTRCVNGGVVPSYAYTGGALNLKEKGVIMGGVLSSPKARLLLILGLNGQMDKGELDELFFQFGNL